MYGELERGDMDTHTKNSPVEKVSHRCGGNWEMSEIDDEIKPYFEEGSIFEGKEDTGERCSPGDELDGEDVWIDVWIDDDATLLHVLKILSC